MKNEINSSRENAKNKPSKIQIGYKTVINPMIKFVGLNLLRPKPNLESFLLVINTIIGAMHIQIEDMNIPLINPENIRLFIKNHSETKDVTIALNPYISLIFFTKEFISSSSQVGINNVGPEPETQNLKIPMLFKEIKGLLISRNTSE